MNTKKEQIEEMKRVICEGAFDIAHRLYTAGYRKATDVIDEFVERLKEENEISFRRFGKGIGISSVFKIADEMKFELFENGQVNK